MSNIIVVEDMYIGNPMNYFMYVKGKMYRIITNVEQMLLD